MNDAPLTQVGRLLNPDRLHVITPALPPANEYPATQLTVHVAPAGTSTLTTGSFVNA